MGWQDLIQKTEEVSLPWLGGREITAGTRRFTIDGKLPREQGWYRFALGGSQKARYVGPGEFDPAFEEGRPKVSGYVAGGRLIPDTIALVPEIAHIPLHTRPIYMLEPMDRFSRVVTVEFADRLVYVRPDFPLGPEAQVQEAYEDRKTSIRDIPGVTLALELAFRFESWVRAEAERAVLEEEERQLREQRAREEEERRAATERELERLRAQRAEQDAARLAQQEREYAEQMRRLGQTINAARWRDPVARRAALALSHSGAQLLDCINAQRGLYEVRFLYEARRFSCIVTPGNLGIVEAGICLTSGGVRGDSLFTLESLPAVIREAIQTNRLVLTRR